MAVRKEERVRKWKWRNKGNVWSIKKRWWYQWREQDTKAKGEKEQVSENTLRKIESWIVFHKERQRERERLRVRDSEREREREAEWERERDGESERESNVEKEKERYRERYANDINVRNLDW